LDRALGSVQEAAQQNSEPVRAVFAEIHDPRRVQKANDVIDPSDRVRIMAHLGARLVPIDYVQPALDEGRERSDRLLLVAFSKRAEHALDGSIVRDFLLEYYAALAVPSPGDNPDLIRMTGEVGQGPVELVSLDSADSLR
jgi:hypothetical protein